MNRKLAVGLLAIVAYGGAYHLIDAGLPVLPLAVSLFASTLAIGLIVVEWSRV